VNVVVQQIGMRVKKGLFIGEGRRWGTLIYDAAFRLITLSWAPHGHMAFLDYLLPCRLPSQSPDLKYT